MDSDGSMRRTRDGVLAWNRTMTAAADGHTVTHAGLPQHSRLEESARPCDQYPPVDEDVPSHRIRVAQGPADAIGGVGGVYHRRRLRRRDAERVRAVSRHEHQVVVG